VLYTAFLGHEPCRRAFLSRSANSIMSAPQGFTGKALQD
jgi:hypothetical protein